MATTRSPPQTPRSRSGSQQAAVPPRVVLQGCGGEHRIVTAELDQQIETSHQKTMFARPEETITGLEMSVRELVENQEDTV